MALAAPARFWFQSSLELSHECNHAGRTAYERLFLVSILTRAFARVQLVQPGVGDKSDFSFNPHSSFRTSATRPLWPRPSPWPLFQSSLELSHECNQLQAALSVSIQRSFNPHSSFRTSATWVKRRLEAVTGVSILTRAFARVQRLRAGVCAHGQVFQSSLELSHECNADWIIGGRLMANSFNPHSSFRTSATCLHRPILPLLLGFQSSLELSHECNDGVVQITHNSVLVSILTRAFARVQLIQHLFQLEPVEVSILTRAFARVQQKATCALTCLCLFQSSLELSHECNVFRLVVMVFLSGFQSSLELSHECNPRR